MSSKKIVWISPFFVKNNYKSKEVDLWLGLQNKSTPHQPLIDRTGTVKYPFSFYTDQYRVPLLRHTNICLKDVMCDRVVSIKQIATKYNHKLSLFYSGGVDSTAIICAFIQTLGIQETKDILTVFMNEDSIKENPLFYEKYIKSNFKTEKSTQYFKTICDDKYKNDIFINGDPGGTLFGGSIVLRTFAEKYGAEKLTTKDWKKYITDYYSYMEGLPEYAIESSIASAHNASFEINDLYDYFWWFTINFRWISQIFNMFSCCKQLLAENKNGNEYWYDHNLSFYNTKEFQLWSFSNKNLLLSDSLKNNQQFYKKQLKEFIHSFDNNDQYLQQKGKEAYLYLTKMLLPDVQQIKFIDSNYLPY